MKEHCVQGLIAAVAGLAALLESAARLARKAVNRVKTWWADRRPPGPPAAAMLLLLAPLASASAMAQPPAGQSQIGGKEMQGQEVTVDLPGSLQLRNIGSKVDGQGMCVMSSLTHGGTWQGVPKIAGLREWCAREPGGAGPSKVASQLRRYYGEGQVPPYLQAEGEDAFRLLEWADKTGRMGCITYGYSPRYGHCVNHMTNAVRARGNLGVVLDNNFPGEANYEWMSLETLKKRMAQCQRGRACSTDAPWVFVWLAPPPPPVPHN